MSMPNELFVALRWDLQDRLAKSLRVSGLSVQEMADFLDVHRNTVGGWINGRQRMSTQSMRLWAEHTGVPYEWLRYGESQPPEPPHPARPPRRSATVVRHLKDATDMVAEASGELVNARDDRWGWYPEALAADQADKPVDKFTAALDAAQTASLRLLDSLDDAA